MEGGAHMDHRLQPEHGEDAADGEDDEHILGIHQAVIAAQQYISEDGEQDQDEEKAELLARDGKDEIGMGVGEIIFHRALPRPGAEEAAVLEGFQRFLYLIGIAAGGIEEAVDAAADVIEDEISADDAAAG